MVTTSTTTLALPGSHSRVWERYADLAGIRLPPIAHEVKAGREAATAVGAGAVERMPAQQLSALPWFMQQPTSEDVPPFF
jgi:hypothetical protein